MKAARAQRCFGISGGAQLDLLRVDLVRRFDLFRIRIDEKTREYSGLAQAAHRGAHDRDVAHDIETAFGSYFVRILREPATQRRDACSSATFSISSVAAISRFR